MSRRGGGGGGGGYNTYYEPKGGSKEYQPKKNQNQNRDNYQDSYNEYVPKGQSQGSYNQYVPKEEKYVPKEDKYVPKEEKYVPKEDKQKRDKYSNQDSYNEYVPKGQGQSRDQGSGYSQYVPKEDKYVPKEEKYVPKEDKYVPKEEKYAPKEDKQKRDTYSSQSSNYPQYAPKEEKQSRDKYSNKQSSNYSQYTSKQAPKKSAVDEAFPSIVGGQGAFPSLGGEKPLLASTPITEPPAESEWGHSLKKHILPQSTPFVPEPTPATKKTASGGGYKDTSQFDPKPGEKRSSITSSSTAFEPVKTTAPTTTTTTTAAPEVQERPQTQQGSKGKKGNKGKGKAQEEEESKGDDIYQKKTNKASNSTSIFNQLVENLSSKSTAGSVRDSDYISAYEKGETELDDVNDPDHEKYFEEYEKHLKGEQEEEFYDYDGGDYHEEEIGFEEAEAEMDKYLHQNPRDRGGGGLVLMVAEKPSIAKAITEALAGGRSKLRKGRSKFCPVHEFSGSIFGHSAYFRVTSVAGHVFNCDFPHQYQNWQAIEPQKLFDVQTVKKEANPSGRIVAHLQAEAKNASYLVLWLDNDKEGENICFEVLDNVKDYMRKENFMQVYRAKFSSIVKQDIQEAFRNIHSGPNRDESMSVDARQIIDLKIGVAFSRFQTMYFTTKYPNLNTKLVSYGPCQTPTLGFCVKRDDEIKNFKPKTFYRVVPILGHNSGTMCELMWSGEKMFSQQEAHKIKQEIEKTKEVVVTHVSTKDGVKGRPEALNTVQLLRVASGQLGIGPQQAMHIAERLYLSGYLTYPRTESTSYPGKYDFRGIIVALSGVSTFSDYAKKLLQGEMRNPKGGKDVGDHPPITPTNKTASRDMLHGDEWRVYEYVARHFMATISPDAKITKRAVTFQTGQYEFTLNGSVTQSLGFTEIMPWIKLNDNIVPEFKLNQTYLLSIVDVRVGQTQAPDHLTESELITLMEQHGIGTDASMATHINNICERNYVKVTGSNRKLIPTDLGASLVHGYELIDPDLVAPTLRANIEKSVDMIAKGKANFSEVLKEVLAIFTKKFMFFKENINKMDTIFGGSFGTVEENIAKGRPFSKCGKCNRLLKFADKFNKLHCEQCNVTYELPTGGSFHLAGDRKCPLDNFGLLLYIIPGVQNARYFVCPHCYNNSPFPDISTTLTCNLCIQADCPYSVPHQEIKDCDICKEGQLVIDQQAGPKATATCNGCMAEILIADNTSSVVRSNKECDSCGAYLFKTIALKSAFTGLSQLKYENVCIFCHKEFAEITKPKLPPNPFRRGGGGRGRRGGRRRGGRRGGRKKVERDWRDI